MTNISRRLFLQAAGASAFQAGRRPNILFLMTDQHSVSALSANGNPYLRTPAMDSLAANGVSFKQSHCTYPVCSPARSSLFTSRMPHETGVWTNGMPIRDGIPTMGEIFQKAGYRTVYGGKWHVPKSFGEVPGFERIVGGRGKGAAMDEPLATACVDFLSKKPEEPFLLTASFMNPHDICDWIRQHRGSRAHSKLSDYPPAPANMAVDPNEPEYMQFHRTGMYNAMSQAVGIASEWKRDDFRFYLYAYYRLVEEVDRQIGRVLTALRQSGLMDNTLIVLTSDHGEGMGAHRWAQKAAFWEETVKVPLIVSGVGVKRTGMVDEVSLVSGLDVLPTLCDYAGVPAPETIRGRSLRAALEGGKWDRDFLVSELADYGDKTREGRMLRTPRYKYVVFNGGARPEQLFDLELDPGEVLNLAPRPEGADVLGEHQRLLARWFEETGDKFKPA